jgi:hypothetical protein
MMRAWYHHSKSVLEQSSDLGTVREHFIASVLSNFLPKTVIVGRGEIIDGTEKGRSGQQDIILYRADFPVISSHTLINTYMIEGVIATIEVKSNLQKTGLAIPFINAAQVKRLEAEAMILPGSVDGDIQKLKAIHTVKTVIVGYEGWKNPKSMVDNYKKAREEAGGIAPDLVFYPGMPGACVIFAPSLNQSVFTQESPFAVFFQTLLRYIMQRVSITITNPGLNAQMLYTFNRYLSLDLIKAEKINDIKFT